MKRFKKFFEVIILILALSIPVTVRAQEKGSSNKERLETYEFLGQIYEKQRKYDQAIAVYKKALAIEPDDKEVHKSLAKIYDEKKLYSEALLEYKKLIELESDSSRHYIDLANCYTKMGEKNKVVSTLNRLKEELKPTDTWTWYALGQVYKRNKFYKEAESAYQRSIEIDPNYFWSHYALADIYRKQGKYEKALRGYEEALKTTDHKWYINNSRKNIIDIYKKQGRLEELTEELEKKLKEE